MKEERFVSRWGDPQLDDRGYVNLPGWILRNYSKCGVTPLEMMFITHVMSFKYDHREGNPENAAMPSLGKIAEFMGRDIKNVRSLKRSLVNKHLLEVIPHDGGCNEYDFSRFTKKCLEFAHEETAPRTKTSDLTPDENVRSPRTKTSAEYIEGNPEVLIENDILEITPKSPPKTKTPTRKPWSDLTDALHQALPEEIRPLKPEYHKHFKKAQVLFEAGFTSQQVSDFVQWKYATNNWVWTGDEGNPVVIGMGSVVTNIKACSGLVKQWISEGRPILTGRAKEASKVEEVEKPFTIEDDPNNPKNWPIPAKDLATAYQTYKKQLEQIHGITNYEPPELHQPGGENQIPSSPGTNGTQIPPSQQRYLSAMFEHGGRGDKST